MPLRCTGPVEVTSGQTKTLTVTGADMEHFALIAEDFRCVPPRGFIPNAADSLRKIISADHRFFNPILPLEVAEEHRTWCCGSIPTLLKNVTRDRLWRAAGRADAAKHRCPCWLDSASGIIIAAHFGNLFRAVCAEYGYAANRLPKAL